MKFPTSVFGQMEGTVVNSLVPERKELTVGILVSNQETRTTHEMMDHLNTVYTMITDYTLTREGYSVYGKIYELHIIK